MKTKIISAILIMCIGFIACKKDSTTQPVTNQQKILGKWNLISTVANDHYSGTDHITTTTWVAGDYIDFRTNGKAYQYSGGSYDTASYGFINDTKLWFQSTNYAYDIKTLTDTDLELYIKLVINSTDYSEATAKAKR